MNSTKENALSIASSLVFFLMSISLLAQNPIIRHVRTADPSAHIWDNSGTLWIYTSGDPDDAVDYTTMDGYRAFSTTDMVNFKDHGVILHSKDISWGVPGFMFAPTFAFKNGKYYCIYPHAYDSVEFKDKFYCGVAVSDVPQGPFKDIGIIEGVSGNWIDPCVFTDDDGTSYLYWGVYQPKVAKLKDNMLELAEEPRDIDYGEDNFFEAVYMHKKDGLYYFSYNTGTRGQKGGDYSIGDNPYGPFEHKGDINPWQLQDHHSIIEFKGQWYFFYHVDDWNGGTGFRRNTCVEYLDYNEDGTLVPVKRTKKGVEAVK
ncbi:MAG: family 43 glycosylhydrolase [Bacteroidota bacterium]